MQRLVKEQIQNGLRVGAGLGVFLIGALLLGQARIRLEMLSSHNQTGWSDWVVWLEVIAGIGLLFAFVHVWYQLLAECLLFAAVKGLIALMTGSQVFPVHQLPATRIASLAVVVFCTASVLLMVRFMNRKFTIVDRVAITLYFLCFLPPRSSFPSFWEVVGLAALLLSWGVYRWREGHASTSGAPVGAH